MRVKVCNQEKKTKGEKIPFSISSPCDYNVKTKKLPRMTQEFCSTCILFILTVFHKPMTGFRGNIFPLPSAFSYSCFRITLWSNERRSKERKSKGDGEKERWRRIPLFQRILRDSALTLRGSSTWEGDGKESARVMPSAAPPLFRFSFPSVPLLLSFSHILSLSHS